MVFCYCSLGTTLMAFRYYLSDLQVLPEGPLGTTLAKLQLNLSQASSLPVSPLDYAIICFSLVLKLYTNGFLLLFLRYFLNGL